MCLGQDGFCPVPIQELKDTAMPSILDSCWPNIVSLLTIMRSPTSFWSHFGQTISNSGALNLERSLDIINERQRLWYSVLNRKVIGWLMFICCNIKQVGFLGDMFVWIKRKGLSKMTHVIGDGNWNKFSIACLNN